MRIFGVITIMKRPRRHWNAKTAKTQSETFLRNKSRLENTLEPNRDNLLFRNFVTSMTHLRWLERRTQLGNKKYVVKWSTRIMRLKVYVNVWRSNLLGRVPTDLDQPLQMLEFLRKQKTSWGKMYGVWYPAAWETYVLPCQICGRPRAEKMAFWTRRGGLSCVEELEEFATKKEENFRWIWCRYEAKNLEN